MVNPQTLARAEQLLRRELRILEHRFKTKQITVDELREEGHEALERHYENAIEDVNTEALRQDLPRADIQVEYLQELLAKAKEAWDDIVTDLRDL